MIYSMWKKRKLALIKQRLHARRYSVKLCIFHLSCPVLDVIMGPPQCKPGEIIIHPDDALFLITDGIKEAKKAKDRKTERKLQGHLEYVKTVIHALKRLDIADVLEEKRAPQDGEA